MARARPASGGGRWVDVTPERLPRWLDGFRERHGEVVVEAAPPVLRVTAADGTVAELHPPPGAGEATGLAGFLAEAAAPRRLGLLLARRAAAAVGVADGDRLIVSKVDSWYVQSRTAAGGQSQQRFARRRSNQAAAAAARAADMTARVLLPHVDTLAAVVTGGDRRTVETILADARLAPLRRLRHPRHLDVATPNLAVLTAAVVQARAVTVRVRPPEQPSDA